MAVVSCRSIINSMSRDNDLRDNPSSFQALKKLDQL
jgi:hypothetical protein